MKKFWHQMTANMKPQTKWFLEGFIGTATAVAAVAVILAAIPTRVTLDAREWECTQATAVGIKAVCAKFERKVRGTT